jgi:hypothetical protein
VKGYGYDPSLGSIERKIVSGCFAYDDPKNGQVILLIVHQGLHVPNVTSSLIPPFQMRENDVIVRDCPKSQMINPTEDDHSIILEHNGERRAIQDPTNAPGYHQYDTGPISYRCGVQE